MNKFRAWDKRQKKYIDNVVITQEGQPNMLEFPDNDSKEQAIRVILGDPTGHYAFIDFSNWYGIEEIDIECQTPFTDMNRKELYDGDLIYVNDEVGQIMHDGINWVVEFIDNVRQLEDVASQCLFKNQYRLEEK